MINPSVNRYLWHGDPFSSKTIPIAFKNIQLPKKYGGLGILNIKLWNSAAMSRYFNLLLSQNANLWANWVKSNLIKS